MPKFITPIDPSSQPDPQQTAALVEASKAIINAHLQWLDAISGDPDLEPNGDELDGSHAEDEEGRYGEEGHYGNGPGCPISDPPEDNADREAVDEREPEYEA